MSNISLIDVETFPQQYLGCHGDAVQNTYKYLLKYINMKCCEMGRYGHDNKEYYYVLLLKLSKFSLTDYTLTLLRYRVLKNGYSIIVRHNGNILWAFIMQEFFMELK